MNIKVLFILSCLALFSGCQSRKDTPTEEWLEEIILTNTERQVSVSAHALAFDLFRIQAQNHPQENSFMSPFSLSSALSMLMNGAQGECLEEMQQAMGMKHIPMADVNSYFQKVTKGLDHLDSTVTWSAANALWVNSSVPIHQEYTATLSAAYEAKVRSLDFSSPQAASTINNWCKEKTMGKIDRLVDRLSPLTALALTNAIYFNASWTTPFEHSETKEELFYPLVQSSQKTMMMHRLGDCAYLKTEIFEMVELPFGNGNFSMMILLPTASRSWDDCLKELTPAHYQSWCDSLQHNNYLIDLKIPRFQLNQIIDCNALLQQQGMQKMFDENKTNFITISEKPLKVDKVIQSSFIAIQEESVEAASATAITVTFESELIPLKPFIPFHTNRPFLFLLKERSTQAVLFMGRMMSI